jgi:hypothetical protein
MRMRARRAGRVPTLLVLLMLGAAGWATVLSCRNPLSADGAGGQSGDEGVTPRNLGAGGGTAEPPAPR